MSSEACKEWNEAAGVSAMILAREFSPFGAPSPISRELAGEKCLLISRAIAKKSTDPF